MRWVLWGTLVLGGAAGCHVPAQPTPEQLDRELTRFERPAPNPLQPPPAGSVGVGGAGQQVPRGMIVPGPELSVNPSWPSPFVLRGQVVLAPGSGARQ